MKSCLGRVLFRRTFNKKKASFFSLRSHARQSELRGLRSSVDGVPFLGTRKSRRTESPRDRQLAGRLSGIINLPAVVSFLPRNSGVLSGDEA